MREGYSISLLLGAMHVQGVKLSVCLSVIFDQWKSGKFRDMVFRANYEYCQHDIVQMVTKLCFQGIKKDK